MCISPAPPCINVHMLNNEKRTFFTRILYQHFSQAGAPEIPPDQQKRNDNVYD